MKATLLILASALAAVSVAQRGSALLYNPARTIADQGISVQGWGSGVITQTDEQAYQGANSLRVSTRNFFQGGLIRFSNPIDVSAAFADKNNQIEIVYRVAAGTAGRAPSGGAAGGGLGASGLSGSSGVGGGPGGGPPTGGGAPGGAGAPGRGGQEGAAGGSLGSVASGDIDTMRLVVVTSDGKRSEIYVPVSTNRSQERGWSRVAVPLQAIKGLDRTNKAISAIAVSADAVSTFYIGEIRIANDATPISGQPNVRNLNLPLGYEQTFFATGTGGSSVLRFLWDFDSRDGIQVDAEGPVVRRRFRTPGTFKVTLTIEDAFGLKPRYTTTIDVTVNP